MNDLIFHVDHSRTSEGACNLTELLPIANVDRKKLCLNVAMIAARLWGLDRAGELARRWGVPNLRASFPRHDRSDRHRVGSPNRALELALKAVLEASLSTKTDRLLRAGLSNATVPAWVDSDDDWKEINQGHDLTELQRHVDQNLDFIKMQPPSLPAEFAEAANFFKELEEGSPEGLRYSRVRPRQGANKNVLIASAVYGKNVDISRIGSLMRRIAGQHLPRSLTEGNTFYENLRAKGSEEYEALFNEISAVAQATTANVVKWKAINRHIKLWKCDAFGKWPIERNSYPCGEYRGMSLVLVRFEDCEYGRIYGLSTLGPDEPRFVSFLEHDQCGDLPARAEASAGVSLSP